MLQFFELCFVVIYEHCTKVKGTIMCGYAQCYNVFFLLLYCNLLGRAAVLLSVLLFSAVMFCAVPWCVLIFSAVQ